MTFTKAWREPQSNIITLHRYRKPRPKIMLLAGAGWIVADAPRKSVFHWASFATKRDLYRAWILWQRGR